MTSDHIIKELERYRNELTAIMGRFIRSPGNYSIHREDDPRFRTFVIEIIDLLNDSMGENQYSPLINQIFNEGISNFYHPPSYKSIEDIVSVLDSVVTRLKRNPELCNPKKEIITTEKKPIEYPDKITLKWMWSHVPYRFWFFLIGLLITAFSLGITFADTKLYKSLIDLLKANSNMIDTKPQNTK